MGFLLEIDEEYKKYIKRVNFGHELLENIVETFKELPLSEYAYKSEDYNNVTAFGPDPDRNKKAIKALCEKLKEKGII